jgi:hypothetical protein
MLSTQEIEQLLAGGYELRGFELKGPGLRTHPHLFAKVVRAALGMANLRDGGHIVIGINDADPAGMLPGLSPTELQSWLAYDDIARKLGEYADPAVRFALEAHSLSSGVSVAVLQVYEFSDIPILCAKDFPDVLRKGACYVRPRRVPETSEIASSVEMRELLDLAVQKALRAFVQTAERAGVALTTGENEPVARSADQFAVQRKDVW